MDSQKLKIFVGVDFIDSAGASNLFTQKLIVFIAKFCDFPSEYNAFDIFRIVIRSSFLII